MRFLELPTEVRLQIYRFGLVDDEATLCPQTRRSIGPARNRKASCLAILCTNHRVYDEAVAVLYGDSLIRYYTDLAPANRQINSPIRGSETYLRSLQRLELCCNNPYATGLGYQAPAVPLHARSTRQAGKKQQNAHESQGDELANAIGYFNTYKCCLRDVTVTIDFMKTDTWHIPDSIELAVRSRLWQGLAAMNVREKLMIKITTTTYVDSENFRECLDRLIKELASAKGWTMVVGLDNRQSPALLMWIWTLRPKGSQNVTGESDATIKQP